MSRKSYWFCRSITEEFFFRKDYQGQFPTVLAGFNFATGLVREQIKAGRVHASAEALIQRDQLNEPKKSY